MPQNTILPKNTAKFSCNKVFKNVNFGPLNVLRYAFSS